jgi:hypothetical protein
VATAFRVKKLLQELQQRFLPSVEIALMRAGPAHSMTACMVVSLAGFRLKVFQQLKIICLKSRAEPNAQKGQKASSEHPA